MKMKFHIKFVVRFSMFTMPWDRVYSNRFIKKALVYELKKKGCKVERQICVPVIYDGQVLDNSLRLDLLVDDRVIVELKSVESVLKLYHKQLMTYLRLTKKHLGILVNFNSDKIAENIWRIANKLPDEQPLINSHADSAD